MRKKVLTFPLIVLLTFGVSTHTSAESLLLEEVIVSAQKRDQSLQDVGISITSFTGGQIRELGMTNTADIVFQTPSLNTLSFSQSLTVFNIRGISQNEFADHFEAPVAVFVDEAYVSAQGAVDAQLFDLERVEVLRGPQGTLFGRNATGGLVHLISRAPTEGFEGYGELTIAEHDQVKFEGAVGGPLSDKLLGRLSFATNHMDGYIDNRGGQDHGDVENYSYRGQLLFKASEDLKVLVNVHGVESEDTGAGYEHSALFANADGLGEEVPGNVDFYGTCPGCDSQGYRDTDGDVHATDHDNPGFFDRSTTGVTGKITWDRDTFTLTSITDYLEMEKQFQSDSDASPFDIATFFTTQDFEQISQELRLNGETNRVNWVLGAYYLNIDTEQTTDAGVFGAFQTGADYTVDTESWAIFGQAEYNLTPQWSITAGLRYTEDSKEMDYVRNGTGIFAGPEFFDTTVSPNAKLDFENVSAKLQLDWRPTDDVMIYASLNRGHKGGSFAAPLFPPVNPAIVPHDEEVLMAYELGIKATLLDGRAQLNTSAFYYDYDDYQASSFANLSQSIFNVDATIKGFEIEFLANPFDGLDISLGISSLDGEAKNVELPTGQQVDRDMPQSPDLAINGIVRYTWSAFSGELAAQFDYKYSDDFNFYVLNQPATQEDDYFVGNVRLAYTTADEKWTGAIFVNNVTDVEYRVYAQDVSDLGVGINLFAPPKWVGASISYNWN